MPRQVTGGPEQAGAAIEIAGLSKSYGRVLALADVSFAVGARSVTALLGANGAGKTTLFQILTGLFVADAGRAAIEGADIAREPTRALARLGIVFQQQVLDLDLTVAQNLRFYAGLRGLRGGTATAAIMAALERFRIAELVGKRVRDLSGGTRRRVELARALITDPRVLILDEPSQGLDTQSRADLVRDVFALCRERDVSVLWATHLVAEVDHADHVVVLDRGRVIAQGTPADLIAASEADTLERAFLSLVRPVAEPA